MLDFSNQNVLLIGGLSEVAASVAHAFYDLGAQIILCYPAKSEDLLERYPEAIHLSFALDDPDKLTASLQFTAFETAIICPGWFEQMPFMATSANDIDNAFSLNFENPIYATQACARRLIAQEKGGSIIFLSSVAGLMPMVHTNLAGASLAAIEVIARMSAVDLAAHNIRVNVVAAGWTPGTWSEGMLAADGTMLQANDVPGEKGLPATSVGEACSFLASPLANGISGAVLPVDKGFLLTKSAALTPFPDKPLRRTP